MKKMINPVISLVLRIRYRITVHGLKELKLRTQDNRPLLFLSNHQALIDPVIIMSLLYSSFSPRPFFAEKLSDHPLVKYLTDFVQALFVSDFNEVRSCDVEEKVFVGLEEVVASLKRGENVLMYPAGCISSGHLEVIGANRGAVSVIHGVPEARIVLLRIRGLWGSEFSRARGIPSLSGSAGKMFIRVLINGLLFMPRRAVHLEIFEPEDFPVGSDGKTVNQYLERFYNVHPDRNREVPRYWWQGSRPIYHEEVGGDVPALSDMPLKPVSSKWFELAEERELSIPKGNTIADLFLYQARKNPDQVIVSDQLWGERTWRQLIMEIYALLPEIKRISEKRIGIMMPASVGAVVSWLVVMFSGKESVMIDWSDGMDYICHALQNAGVTQVITSRSVTEQLEEQEELGTVGVTWLYLKERVARRHVGRNVAALLKSRLSWEGLGQADFSGNASFFFVPDSEGRPKAVPLTHAALLDNVRDVRTLSVSSNDSLLGILPVFYPVGLCSTIILPLCTGLRTVYWPDPTDGDRLTRMIRLYGVTVLITTPAFFHGILQTDRSDILVSLRLIFSVPEE